MTDQIQTIKYQCQYCQAQGLPAILSINQQEQSPLTAICGSYCQLYGGNLEEQIGHGQLKKINN